MKIHHSRGNALLPRIDRIFLIARGIAIGLLFVSFFLDFIPEKHFLIGLTIGAIFTLHYVIFIFAVQRRKLDLRNAYLATMVLDFTLTTVLIGISGGFGSFYFILYYLIAAMASYMFTREFAGIITALITVGYLGMVYAELDSLRNLLIACFRLSPCWVSYTAISYVAEFLRRSEVRMLKLFDTLNRRTSELEKIQAQLETIYDNSRILGGILDVDEVIKAVMQIVNIVLKYPAAALLLQSGEDNFIFRGRAIDGDINLNIRAAPEGSTILMNKVARSGSPVRIIDIQGRDDHEPLRSDTRSVMLAPMINRNKTIGILLAESSIPGSFSERDEKMFWVVARSAAMAIDNAALHRQMEELTMIDNLTGAFNYRYFTDKLEEEKRRAARYDAPLSLIMLDIDHFKKLNDSFGHEVGNIVLKGVTQIVRGCIRDTDISCRYGGEEFAVILPQTPLDDAQRIAKRIRIMIERTTFEVGDNIDKQGVTVSIGVTSFPENGYPQAELVRLADQAMYRAKGVGRNAVVTI